MIPFKSELSRETYINKKLVTYDMIKNNIVAR